MKIKSIVKRETGKSRFARVLAIFWIISLIALVIFTIVSGLFYAHTAITGSTIENVTEGNFLNTLQFFLFWLAYVILFFVWTAVLAFIYVCFKWLVAPKS